jgi:hypothetical protein
MQHANKLINTQEVSVAKLKRRDLLEELDVDGIKVLKHVLINSMEVLGFNSFA